MMDSDELFMFLLNDFPNSCLMTKLLYTALVAITVVISAITPTAFADSNNIQGEDLKKNPLALDILKKIENSRKEFEQSKQIEQKRIEQQKYIDEQRAIAKQSLEQQLQQMDKTYDEFTPRNAFAKFVSNFNATHQEIYWDQFDYLHAKITLAKQARDTVIQHGGSYSDAMKEYVKFAKMSKIEMQSIIRDLNLKHKFAQDDIQANFDANGKLPRYENDIDAPCYGCNAKLTKVQVNSEQTIPITPVKYEPKPTQIDTLRDTLSSLQKKFLETKDVTLQMKTVSDMNEIVRQIHQLQ